MPEGARDVDADKVWKGGVVRPLKAQFDTGVDIICITRRVVEYFEMKPRGKVEMISVTGIEEANTYTFTLGSITGKIPQKVGGFTGRFSFFETILGSEIYTHDDDDLDILIGMDIIGSGSLRLEPFGQWTFWF